MKRILVIAALGVALSLVAVLTAVYIGIRYAPVPGAVLGVLLISAALSGVLIGSATQLFIVRAPQRTTVQ